MHLPIGFATMGFAGRSIAVPQPFKMERALFAQVAVTLTGAAKATQTPPGV